MHVSRFSTIPRLWRRRAILASPALLASTAALSGCTDNEQPKEFELGGDQTASVVLPSDPTALTIALNRTLYGTNTEAIVAPDGGPAEFISAALQARIPFFVGDADELADALTHHGIKKVAVPEGQADSFTADGIEVIELNGSNPDLSQIGPQEVTAVGLDIALILDPDELPESADLAKNMVRSVGGRIVEIPGGDPRVSSATVKAAKDATRNDPDSQVLALGESFGDTEQFIQRLTAAVTSPELPGGGQLIHPYRRFVATYGAPGTPSLGVLGEQPLDKAIERTKQIAKEYEPFSDLPVISAFEIIATVASASAGPDGDYSANVPIEDIDEWIKAAGEAGMYVVLDLQPGRTDFLTQAKMFEEQLKNPHVGLALDAEWRLKPNQVHLKQIGSVDYTEVDRVSEWLAALVRDNNLPQKVYILHQFSLNMIRGRENLNTGFPELTFMLHADGHGTPELKMATWRALQNNLPSGILMAWKNFYDEDKPTFTPKETYNIEPRPWFVSYQ